MPQTDDPYKAIGLNIKAERLRQGLTQKQLADALNKVPQSVLKWEQGTTRISTTMLADLAKALGCDVSKLTIGTIFDPMASKHRSNRIGKDRVQVLSTQETAVLDEFRKIKELPRRKLAIQLLRVFAAASKPD